MTSLIAGCAGETFKLQCPVLVKYTNQQLVSVADELKKDNENVKQLVKDYQRLRDACRSLKD